jgi:hypothetical protein
MRDADGAGRRPVWPEDASAPREQVEQGPGAESRSGDPARPDARATADHLAPDQGQSSITPVSELSLAKVEAELTLDDYSDDKQRTMAENFARRQADQETIIELQRQDFKGLPYEYFAAELAAYGFAVMMAWMRTREIFKQCKDKGRPLSFGLTRDWSREDRMGLAGLTVAKALVVFRDQVLRPAKWDPGRGATLKTYFVGACVQQFPNFYDSWMRQEQRWDGQVFYDAEDPGILLAVHAPSSDPAQLAVDRHLLRQCLADMDEKLQQACRLILVGWTYEAAGAVIGISGEALAERLRRFRKGRGGRRAR